MKTPTRMERLQRAIADAILDRITEIPASEERRAKEPATRAAELTRAAAREAAMFSAGLALPSGPLGLLTIVPDLIKVWRVQVQLIADIAAAHGRHAKLNREQVLYCLFSHAASNALRDLLVRVGERVVVRKTTLVAMQHLVAIVGINVIQRVISKSVGRWVPGIGAAAVGAYAYYDTRRVGRTAAELFATPIRIEKERPPAKRTAARKSARPRARAA
jgi:hypothetical protein